MAKSVDATDLKSVGKSRAGSIPAERTKYKGTRKEAAKIIKMLLSLSSELDYNTSRSWNDIRHKKGRNWLKVYYNNGRKPRPSDEDVE